MTVSVPMGGTCGKGAADETPEKSQRQIEREQRRKEHKEDRKKKRDLRRGAAPEDDVEDEDSVPVPVERTRPPSTSREQPPMPIAKPSTDSQRALQKTGESKPIGFILPVHAGLKVELIKSVSVLKFEKDRCSDGLRGGAPKGQVTMGLMERRSASEAAISELTSKVEQGQLTQDAYVQAAEKQYKFLLLATKKGVFKGDDARLAREWIQVLVMELEDAGRPVEAAPAEAPAAPAPAAPAPAARPVAARSPAVPQSAASETQPLGFIVPVHDGLRVELIKSVSVLKFEKDRCSDGLRGGAPKGQVTMGLMERRSASEAAISELTSKVEQGQLTQDAYVQAAEKQYKFLLLATKKGVFKGDDARLAREWIQVLVMELEDAGAM
eukprot:TRINITY_DN4229_c0_g1_i2.p1 TRINITY_DN4229_c0_g1~~TRINITY_DN4229_c0_g1_i2.p1  ORF type:complete len:382 (+),score=100.36 TRINITY_DN4229_c0_g1_i2:144-1289(+)